MKFAALIAAALGLLPAAERVQYYPPPGPYAPYVQPSPYAPQAYPVTRGQPYFPPTLPPGSPSLMIPNPTIAPLPPYQWYRP